MMLRYLLEKEFKQFFRNSFLPRLIILFPVMVMLVMPWVATMDVRDVEVCAVDLDGSALSRRLLGEVEASRYFKLRSTATSYALGLEKIEQGDADLVVEIPAGFERDVMRGTGTQIFVSANAVNGIKGSMGSGYMASIINGFTGKLAQAQGTPVGEGSIVLRNLYNPTLNYRHFMIPAMMAVLLMMLCGFLPALNIVGEKEKGTIEQMNVTPVGKYSFILAKLIPYWVIGTLVLTLCFVIGWAVYGYLPAGSFLTIYGGTTIFIVAMSGFGLIVSNYSHTMQQAILVMFFFMLIFNLMSGLFTPVESMPSWAQWMAAAIPPRYFIEIMRGVYQRGAGFVDLWPQFAALTGFALLFGLLAVATYRKRN